MVMKKNISYSWYTTISLLAYFKYYNFFVEIILFTSNFELIAKSIILPLGILSYLSANYISCRCI